MTKPTIIVISLISTMVIVTSVAVSFRKKLNTVSMDHAHTRELLTNLQSQAKAKDAKIVVLQKELLEARGEQITPSKATLQAALERESSIQSILTPDSPQERNIPFSTKPKNDTLSQLERNALKGSPLPKELMEIKAAMSEDELAAFEQEVDRRLFQRNTKIANDLGITADELDQVTSIADQRVIELMRSSCEESVLYDRLMELNEEVFKEINSEP